MIRTPVKTLADLCPFDYVVILEMIVAIKSSTDKRKPIDIVVDNIKVGDKQFCYLFGDFISSKNSNSEIAMFFETMNKMAEDILVQRKEEKERQIRKMIEDQIEAYKMQSKG